MLPKARLASLSGPRDRPRGPVHQSRLEPLGGSQWGLEWVDAQERQQDLASPVREIGGVGIRQ